MTNNEKIQRAERLVAEANALLIEAKAANNNEEDVIAKYKINYNKGRKYHLNNQSKVDLVSVYDSLEKVKGLSQSPYQYYLMEELAIQAKKMKDFNDKLLSFKYCYDSDYKPNWNNSFEDKYYVYYSNNTHMYDVNFVTIIVMQTVYFSSREIAQKCADWLNSLSE